ncbi:hypothetical protein ASPACDRAFT_62766 [Aspergillus aculeatus ATCC 16872]|uniref:Uncharacterized protein n=1 Tax=Aspergillus aculeatus (strain ATCC 16872 / CBS 172.66 / WB 5094) TaxID=690307 RepID=A0A1L9WLS9_ASPA1|nr:uncharacterized protein ASPACDRAFT_62766 [Aspergillus aculeatus ATCC 16872]OJJ97050.1 hypothetical protein ASPACDRAFT_62766 [Aspergillus aculeatus ATCC 16872]
MSTPPEALSLPEGWTLTPITVGPDMPYSAHGKHEKFLHAIWSLLGVGCKTECVGAIAKHLVPEEVQLPGESRVAECLGVLVWFGLPAVHRAFETSKPAYGVIRTGNEIRLYREVAGEVPPLPPLDDPHFPSKQEPPRTIYQYEFHGRKAFDWIADKPRISQWAQMVENDPSFATTDVDVVLNGAKVPRGELPLPLPQADDLSAIYYGGYGSDIRERMKELCKRRAAMKAAAAAAAAAAGFDGAGSNGAGANGAGAKEADVSFRSKSM